MVGALAAVMAAATLYDPLAFQADDSWFYLVIGRNVADGHGITFSQVVDTNGFQPLWQAVVAATLVVAHAVGVTSAVGEARVVLTVGWVLLGVGCVLLHRLLGRFGVPAAGRALALLAVVGFLGGPLGTVGSEANLVFALVVAAVSAVIGLADGAEPTGRRVLAGGGLLGLMVLGRLDTGFVVVAALAAVVLLRSGRPWERVRPALLLGLVASAVVVPYLAWNQVRFGHLLPIAGAIKLDRSQLWFTPASLGVDGWLLLGLGAAGGLLAFAGRRPARRELVAWGVPYAGACLSSAVYFAWSPGNLTDLDWYRMPHLLAVAVATGLVARRLAAVDARVFDLGVRLAAVVLLPFAAWFMVVDRIQGENHDFWHPVADFSEVVGELVPDGEVVATVDYPGVAAAYSGDRVLALDGLTGDYDLQAELRDEGPCALARREVSWLIVDDDDRLFPRPDGAPGHRVQVTSWLHREGGGDLLLDPGDLAHRDPVSGLSLWRVRPACNEG